jgi:DNA primase
MNELEEIKNKTDIVEYVGKYVQLKQSGRNFKGLCPFHSEKTPSFMVSPDKQIWHCFGCNEGGDVIAFVEKMDALSFPEAVRELAQRTGVKLSQNFNENKEPTEKLFEINEAACRFYEEKLNFEQGKTTYTYLEKRGLSTKTIKEFRLGYSPAQGEVLIKELVSLGYKKEELVKAGVAGSKNGRVYDQFRNRLMFPIMNAQGKVIGFSARVLDNSLPKYINTPETPIYHKSNILFGFDKAKEQIRKQDHIILVEGNMDVIFSYQAGVKNIAAASGTALTEAQLNLIKRYTKNIKMSFDVDLAGQNATKRAIEMAQGLGFNIKIIEIPTGKDPADLVKADPSKWVNACKNAKYVVDYIFEGTFKKYNIINILDKKRATSELLEVISRLPDPVEKEHYLQILAGKVGVSLQALQDALRKAKGQKTKTQSPEKPKIENKPKQSNLEEHIMSLLFAKPLFADFVFNKLKASDFSDPRLSRLAEELRIENEKEDDIDLKKWRGNQTDIDQEYIDTLVMKVEDEFVDAPDDLLGEEIFNSVLRLHQNNIEKAKKVLRNEIDKAEKDNDKTRLNNLMSELAKLIERERNI